MGSSYIVGLVLEHFQRKWSRTANYITTPDVNKTTRTVTKTLVKNLYWHFTGKNYPKERVLGARVRLAASKYA